MKKISVILLLTFAMCITLKAQNVRGIRIESSAYPVIVYLNDVQVSTATQSCFIANLDRGSYKIEVYKVSRHSGRNSNDRVYSERIHYDGRGIKDIVIAGAPVDDYPPGPEHGMLPPMNRKMFDQFYSSLKSEPFDSGKESIIKVAIKGNSFSCEQVKKICELYTFDSNRLPLLKRFYPNIIDKGNVFTLVDILSFSSSKKEFMKFVEDYN